MANDGPRDGLRILSLDGPPLAAAALSEPHFLREIAHRWAFKEDNEGGVERDDVRVSDMFDIIGGCGIGGLYAILFARLNLAIGQVLQFHKTLQDNLFAAECWTRKDQKECIKAFDKALDELLSCHNVDVDLSSSFFATDCKKCFVVVLNSERTTPRFLHSYRARANPSPLCTIRQALHATLADLEHLPSVEIEDELFIGTSIHVSNPARILLKELAAAFPALHLACFVSLGADRTLPVNDSRMIGQDLISQFQDLNCFFRLSVKEELLPDSRITSSVRTHLLDHDVSRTVDEIVEAIKGRHRVLKMLRLGNLAGEDGRNVQHRKVSHIYDEGVLERARKKIRAPYDFPPIHEHGCLEGTREDVLQHIEGWAEDLNTPNVFWLEGYPGTGKTAITITLKQRLAQARRLGASCFFRREDSSQHNSSHLFRCIASQLVDNHESIRDKIVETVNSGAVRLDSAPAIVFEKLLYDPLNAAFDGPNDPIVLILDAMDEFGHEEKDRLLLIKLLLPKWIELPRRWKLLITSRSQGYLPLHLDLLSHSIRRLEVGNATSLETRSDIRRFFEHYFEEIRNSRGNSPEIVESSDLDELVDASAGLFIWASTVVEMVRRMRKHVRDILYDLRERKTTIGETQMDALYHLYFIILQPLLNNDGPIVRFLSAVICAKTPLPATALSPLCDLDVDVIEDTAWNLRPVMDTANGLRFVHKSFVDYVISRYCPIALVINNAELMLGVSCLKVMISQLHFNMGNIQSSYLMNSEAPELREALSEELRYASRFWGAHLMYIQKWGKPNVVTLTQSIEDFFARYFLYWVETVSILGCFREAIEVLTALRRAEFNKEVNDFAHDARTFILQFVLPISQSYPHIYISALPCTPTTSIIRARYLSTVPHTLKILSNGDDVWPVQVSPIRGHAGDVLSVAFSPDGSQIISGSKDKTVRIWDASTRQPIGGPLRGHKNFVNSVAFSLDGSQIVSGSSDKTIRIWDATTRQLIGEPLIGHSSSVLQVTFSPDGSQIASASRDKTVRIWDAVTRQPVGEPLQGHNSFVNSVAFSPDGSRIVSGSSDQTIRVWNATSFQLIGEPIEGHSLSVNSVSISPDGSQIISGSTDKTVKIWDASTFQPVGQPLVHDNHVQCVIFSPDGSQIAIGTSDASIHIWDAATRKLVGEPFKGHISSVTSVSFTPDGYQIASASTDMTIRIWDATPRPVAKVTRDDYIGSVESVAYSPDGLRIASGNFGGTIRIWDAVTHDPVGQPFRSPFDCVEHVIFSPDGSQIVSRDRLEITLIWDVMTGQYDPAHSLSRCGGLCRSLVFSPDGSYIACGSEGDSIQIFHAVTHRPVGQPLRGHKGSVSSIAFSPDGSHIASGSTDNTVRIWDASTRQPIGEPLQGHHGPVNYVAFSPDGSQIVSGSSDKTILVWNATTFQLSGVPLCGHDSDVRCVAFSPDGSRIASASDDQTIWLWNSATGQPDGEPLRGHTGPVKSLAFSPDGSQIVSGSSDNSLRIWDIGALQSVRAPGPMFKTLSFPRGSHSLDLHCFLRQDGWVVDQQERHLLWIPQHLHDKLPTPNLLDVIGPQKMLAIDASDFRRGAEWTSCIDMN